MRATEAADVPVAPPVDPIGRLAIAFRRLARRSIARFARADLRALHHVDEAVVLFVTGKFVDARLDARPDVFRRPRPGPGRRVLDREFILEGLRIRDRQPLDEMHAARRTAPLAPGI